ncbi:DNA replication terminus site-binding protein [Thalassolituus sp.]|uniref:DNA replication terminus site-binding protein n=1 Tax=Thalassolituus sp. TaxID=2030822 RepID=UPI002A806FEE|nr:DNA replication terminus site-binding protein [Thalassolituus sp.]
MAQLRQHIEQQSPSYWFPLSNTEQAVGLKPLNSLCDLLCDFWYHDNQDGRETRSRHGLIVADPQTQTHIAEINVNKDRLRAAIREMKETLGSNEWQLLSEQLSEEHIGFRQNLANAGLARLHLKQCVRHIPLLSEMPKRVGFSWYTNGRSIKRISIKEAEEKLLNLGADKPHIQIQLERLGQLRGDTKLAQMQTLAPVVRANLVFETHRKAMNASLPLFLPTDNPHADLPAYKDIPLEPPVGRTRQSRDDFQLSDVPLLPSLRIYTYRD